MKLSAMILALFLPYVAFAGHHEEKPAATAEKPAMPVEMAATAEKPAMPAMPAMPAAKPAMPAAKPAMPTEKPAARVTPAS